MVAINAQLLNGALYPILRHPGGIEAGYRSPNTGTILVGPDGRLIRNQAAGAELKLQSDTVLVREQTPENVIIEQVRREHRRPEIAEEVVSKIPNGQSLIVGKIAQPLPLSAASTTGDRSVNLNGQERRVDVTRYGSNGSNDCGSVCKSPPVTVGDGSKSVEGKVNFDRPSVREPGPLGDGNIYPPVMFDDPNIAALIPDGPVIVDEQIAREHLYIEDGPLLHPGTGALYHPDQRSLYRPQAAPPVYAANPVLKNIPVGQSGIYREPQLPLPPGSVYREVPDGVYREMPPVYRESVPEAGQGPVVFEREVPTRPVLAERRLRPPVYEYAKYSPTVVIRSGPAITRLEPVLTSIPVTTILDAAPVYVSPGKFIPGVAVAKGTSVSTIAESRIDVVEPATYLTPPEIKEPIIVNKW